MKTRRTFLRDVAALAPAAALLAEATGTLPNEFFAMDTAMVKTLGTPLQRSDIDALAQLHYKGLGPYVSDETSWKQLIEEVLPWLEKDALKLYAAYSWARVDRSQFVLDPGIAQNLAALKGKGTIIWLPVSSKEFKPSDPEGDDLAVAAVRSVADEAAKYGCAISLYPHFGNLIQRVEDGVRICEKAGRDNVGVTFNLCHWLRTDGPDSMRRVLSLARPRLSLVTINGADRDGKDWNRLIQPLDRGSFDLKALLGELRRIDYRGPIGLQGYDVAKNFNIEPRENLERSAAAWRKLAAAS